MIRAALFGAGNIARRGHLEALRQAADLAGQYKVVACCDPVPASLEAIRAELPAARLYGTPEALWAAEAPDAVDICAPPDAHAALIRAAVARGAHVFCEKPLCRTLAEAAALDDLLRSRPLAFMPAHQYHHAPQWRAVVAAVRAGEIGAPRCIDWAVWRREANPGDPRWRPAWRTDPAIAGGGILMDHGAHVLYQLRELLGNPLAVTARHQSLRAERYRVEDTASVIFEYPQAVARLSFTWASSLREIACRFVGTEGEIRVADDRVVLARGGAERELSFARGLSAGSAHAEWFVPLLREFVDRVRRKDASRGPWDEALAVLRTLDACYRSHAEGRTVALPTAREVVA